MNQNGWNFLWYSYFEITQEDAEKDPYKALEKCIRRAYLDLCRTVKFTRSSSELEKIKKSEKDEYIKNKNAVINILSNLIKEEIMKLLEKPEKFDYNHKILCKKIIQKTKENKYIIVEEFSYGQAQKWVNMTLKYMMIMGWWEDKFEGVKSYLHVPIDSYIMEEASEEFQIDIPRKNKGDGKYSESGSKPWSCWEEKEYDKFQSTLKKKCDSPIDWEGPAWIARAKKRRNNQRTSKQ